MRYCRERADAGFSRRGRSVVKIPNWILEEEVGFGYSSLPMHKVRSVDFSGQDPSYLNRIYWKQRERASLYSRARARRRAFVLEVFWIGCCRIGVGTLCVGIYYSETLPMAPTIAYRVQSAYRGLSGFSIRTPSRSCFNRTQGSGVERDRARDKTLVVGGDRSRAHSTRCAARPTE